MTTAASGFTGRGLFLPLYKCKGTRLSGFVQEQEHKNPTPQVRTLSLMSRSGVGRFEKSIVSIETRWDRLMLQLSGAGSDQSMRLRESVKL